MLFACFIPLSDGRFVLILISGDQWMVFSLQHLWAGNEIVELALSVLLLVSVPQLSCVGDKILCSGWMSQ